MNPNPLNQGIIANHEAEFGPLTLHPNPINRGIISCNAHGIGPVTREMVQNRTRELAMIYGRTPGQISQADYERAKRELTGESDRDRQDAILDALPESKRWDPVPGSSGHQMPASSNEDEDAEGRNETEQLVNEGMMSAARDRMLMAAQASDHEPSPKSS